MLTGTVVLKENHIQMVTDLLGDIPAGDTDYGLYYYDTRYLSSFELRINEQRPIYLSHSADRNYIANFQFVNPNFVMEDGTRVRTQTVSMRRARFVDERSFQERLGFYNCNHFPLDLQVTLSFDADFRDMFAIREICPQRLAGQSWSRFGPEGLFFSYTGRDNISRHVTVDFSMQPEAVSANRMMFNLHLEPHVPTSITLAVRPSSGPRRKSAGLNFDVDLEKLGLSYERWNSVCTGFETDNEFFDRSLLRQSRLDIRSLLEFNPSERNKVQENGASRKIVDFVTSAGIPWYAVPFGRDSIIAALQTLIYNPSIAEGTLYFLARHQGERMDELTEEEPGKIMHELRRGELANLREIPHLPYYGTNDATPLFIILFVETMAWIESEALYRDLLPHALRALEWIDGYGDVDGDGFVEYKPKHTAGVYNQGWKDSPDSLQYENGRSAELPAALVEVQGYVYHAKMGMSRLAGRHGDAELAKRLSREAGELRDRFNKDFWMPESNFLAQALDAEKRQIRSITSNAGHGLWSGIVDEDKAELVVRRLLAPDMFSGWGIRTLSGESPNYNPMSYHNGSVWPHDNSLIALGMRRYGYARESTEVISAMIEAGLRFPSNRLPELFCGFARDRRFNSSPMSYIRSCSPQAWSAAAPFLFLQTLLDVQPGEGGRTVFVDPAPTELFRKYRIEHMRMGAGRVGFTVRTRGGEVQVEQVQGDVGVEAGRDKLRAGSQELGARS